MVGALQLGNHRIERACHVGAGVAIGNRVDVEPVDPRGVSLHRIAERDDGVAQRIGAEVFQGRHGGQTTDARLVPSTRHLLRGLGDCGNFAGSISALVWIAPGRSYVMAAVCEVCGKGPSFGMNVSHSHRRTKRRWNPNIQRVRALVSGSPKRLNVCTGCIKSGKIVKAG